MGAAVRQSLVLTRYRTSQAAWYKITQRIIGMYIIFNNCLQTSTNDRILASHHAHLIPIITVLHGLARQSTAPSGGIGFLSYHVPRIDAVSIFDAAKAGAAAMIPVWKRTEQISPLRQYFRYVPDLCEHIRPALPSSRKPCERSNTDMCHTISNLGCSSPKPHLRSQSVLLDKTLLRERWFNGGI